MVHVGLCSRQDLFEAMCWFCDFYHAIAIRDHYSGKSERLDSSKTLRLIGLCGIAKYSVKLFVGFFSHRQRMNMIWQEDIFTSILTGTALRKSCRNFIQRTKHWHHDKDGSFKYTQYQRLDKSKQEILHVQMFYHVYQDALLSVTNHCFLNRPGLYPRSLTLSSLMSRHLF